MNGLAAAELLADLLLVMAAALALLCALGLLVMEGFHDKLHYLAPIVLATAAVVLAVFLQEGLNPSSIKALLVFLVVMISNPVLTYAAARADHLRKGGKE
ncbi:monovalent cation/H(+) antiporter subunit G [Geomesophilobacter sediminis]|uniref:Monovalent cation/H(+) antiporter subunit G n=1 Tax=Geomesophilobacter sediminis TaxID=2798584 RepID=A0A8J7IQG0_9BACT|nr:monovalent cation/H(+) antiporter subunit G [Geomesophilobacter sediminis]MBJ6726108.1 monovalent cation/H(+) antiporter subunit G [Geomesophilobacter sediminis]